MPKKFKINKQEDIDRLLSTLEENYLNDEFTGCQESSRSIFKFNVIQKLQ